jgi:hypothetical protein
VLLARAGFRFRAKPDAFASWWDCKEKLAQLQDLGLQCRQKPDLLSNIIDFSRKMPNLILWRIR